VVLQESPVTVHRPLQALSDSKHSGFAFECQSAGRYNKEILKLLALTAQKLSLFDPLKFLL
jgi:hypothetical protein